MSAQGESEGGSSRSPRPLLDPRVGSSRGPGAGGSTFTVIVAAAANFGVALAKAVAGVLSGSSAMLAEAGHSVADTVTELLLLVALKRSKKPPDAEHPLGYGPERYIWALLASVATFVGGGVFAVYDGIRALTHGEEPGNPLVSYIVLAVAFVLEGFSLRTGVKQATGRARHFSVPVLRYLRHTPDTAVKAVVMEDTAALVGLALAALGLLGGQLTGSSVWDGIASVLIGLLLVVVAWVLGRSNTELLVGRALPAPLREAVERELTAVRQIEDVLELTTLVQGPGEILIAAKVDFRDAVTSEEIERACEEAEARLRAMIPAVKRVYLDPTPPRNADREGPVLSAPSPESRIPPGRANVAEGGHPRGAAPFGDRHCANGSPSQPARPAGGVMTNPEQDPNRQEGPADGGAAGAPGVHDGGADGGAEGPADGGAAGTPGVHDGGADGGAEGPADGGAAGTPGVHDGGADGSADESSPSGS